MRLWVRAELWRRRGALAGLALVTALASSFVLASVAGAHRAATAWHRLEATLLMPQVLGDAPADDMDAVARDLRARPDVRAVGRFTWMPVSPEGTEPGVDAATFASIDPDFGTTVARPVVREGRLADQSRADEITVNEPMAARLHLHVGDRVTLVGSVGDIRQPATVVGITRGLLEQINPGGPFAQTTAAFWSAWGPAYVRTLTEMGEVRGLRPAVFVTVAPGADAAAVATETAAAHPAANLGAGSLPDPSRDATRAVVVALLALAAAAGVAVVAVLGLAGARLVRASSDDRDTLGALGAGRAQRRLAALAPTALAVAAGASLGVPLAWAASTWLPFGPVRTVDPHPGRYLDAPALAVAGIAVVALVVAVAAAGLATRSSAAPTRAAPPLPGLGPPSAVGVAAATGVGRSGPGRRRGRATIGGLAVGVTGVVALCVVTAGFGHLLDEARSYGWTFDAALTVESTDGKAPVEAARVRPGIEAASLARIAQVAVAGGSSLDAYGLEPLRGDVFPPLLSGRAPAAPDEVVLAPGTARRTGRGVGDEIAVGDASFRVTGIAVVPPLGNSELGEAVVLTPAGFDRAGVAAEPTSMLLVRAPGDHQALAASLGASGEVVEPFLPGPLVNLDHVRNAPVVLAVFLALLGLAALAFGLSLSVRTRRVELAVLRSLGCTGGQLRRSVVTEAVTTCVVATVVGVPAGLVVGRLVWRLLLGHLPVTQGFGAPWPAVALVAAGALVCGAALSVLPGRRAARLQPARVLRAE